MTETIEDAPPESPIDHASRRRARHPLHYVYASAVGICVLALLGVPLISIVDNFLGTSSDANAILLDERNLVLASERGITITFVEEQVDLSARALRGHIRITAPYALRKRLYSYDPVTGGAGPSIFMGVRKG